jgi:DNA polymerase-1
MPRTLKDFEKIWCVDFEFISKSGEKPAPICYVAEELNHNKVIKKWCEVNDPRPEFLDDDALFVAYFSSAEVGCLGVLGWKRPRNILDLFAEFRCLTNGKHLPSGRGLLGACDYYGIGGGDAGFKEVMRTRILEGPPYSEIEQEQILNYCALDVTLTKNLFGIMINEISLNHALLRGRYMAAVGGMELNGVPINTTALKTLKENWVFIKDRLINKIDRDYGVYENGVFKSKNFVNYLKDNNIEWETTPSGLPKLDEVFFKEQAKAHPILKPLQELRFSLSQLKLNDLQVGMDGRNRSLLSPFGTITGRNTPSSSRFIFGNSVWLRNLIKPEEGKALAYIDYSQQELGIAAALSGDENLIRAYKSGDPYIAFAKLSGAVPNNATKETHPDVRELYKTCMLGINYGMREQGFARRTNLSLSKAKEIFGAHHLHFARYWEWIHDVMDTGQLLGYITTRWGWRAFTKTMSQGTLQNFPMQSTGADILRLACCLCFEQGVKLIAPIHDALLIEDVAGSIENSVETTQWCMTEASRYIINFPINTDVKIIKYPEHYTDRRGDIMWKSIWEVINER